MRRALKNRDLLFKFVMQRGKLPIFCRPVPAYFFIPILLLYSTCYFPDIFGAMFARPQPQDWRKVDPAARPPVGAILTVLRAQVLPKKVLSTPLEAVELAEKKQFEKADESSGTIEQPLFQLERHGFQVAVWSIYANSTPV